MKKILVVEDDQDIVEALSLRLEAAGYEVIKAYDVILGTMAAINSKPDLAILDVSMPGGNGLILAERIKENPEVANMPFLFITASKKPEIREQAMALGASGFIEKPYDAKELMDMVESTLKASAA